MDIHYGQVLAKELYEIEISEDKYEELALLAHNTIGNKQVKLYRYVTQPDENGVIELPCNCTELLGITTLWKDWNHVTNKDWNGDWDSAWIELWINSFRAFKDPQSVPGKYVKYEQVGNKIYLDYPMPVFILYRGEILDDNGLPDVSELEAQAIAAFVAQYVYFKKGIKTMNKNMIEISDRFKREWLEKCTLAKSIQHITLNLWNEILDVKSSWDRHQYGKSYHLMR